MPAPAVHRFTAFGGARCEILAVGANDDELSMAVAEVYAFEARLTRFRDTSELSLLNAAAGRRVAVSPLLEALLRAASWAHERSDGLVDAAVLPALRAAGYDATIEVVRGRTGTAVAPAPGLRPVPALPDALEIGDGWARVAPGCALDLGGVGKGWLADRIAERLEDAAVNLGGDLRAVGGGPSGEGWRVGLCDGAGLLVRDAGVATSGTAGRRWPGGHHLVDPRTGRPAATDAAALSVVSADALTAEVLAKGAAIAGCDAGPGWARARGALHAVAVRDPAGGGASGPAAAASTARFPSAALAGRAP